MPAHAVAVTPLSSAARRARRTLSSRLHRVRLDRVAVGTALLAAMVLLLVETSIAGGGHAVPLAAAFALTAVHVAALPVAVRLPRTAAGVALVAALALQATSATTSAIWPWWPVLIVTQGLVLAVSAARVGWAVAIGQWVVAIGASSVLAAVLRPDDGDGTAVNLLVFGGVSGAAIAVAQGTAQWQRIRDQLLRERAAAADEAERRLLMEERARIARELHDVIAHSMSIITVQSTTARFRHPGFEDAAIEEFERIGALSRQALDEMRGLLRVLRGSDEAPELRPQPGVQDLPELVEQASRAGTPVTLDLSGVDPAAVGELTGVAAYRIAQEAISNAFRHAPGSAVDVVCQADADRLLLTVSNPAADSPDADGSRAAGHGLVGMAERAASVGGAVRAAPTPDGGFTVRAVLPLRATTLLVEP